MSFVDVVASKIDNIHLYFECPYCRTSYNKNGTPRHNSKPVIHYHGSDNDLSNRIEFRSPHCTKKNLNTDFNFRILIDDSTIRV